MPISLACSTCGKKLKAPDSAAGRRSKCPGCGASLLVPAVGLGAAASAHVAAPLPKLALSPPPIVQPALPVEVQPTVAAVAFTKTPPAPTPLPSTPILQQTAPAEQTTLTTDQENEKALGSISGGFLFSGAKEEIRTCLTPGERILRAINANASIASSGERLSIKPFNFSNKKPGIFVVTSKRVFHVAKVLWTIQFEQIALDQIDSAEFSTGMIFASLRVYSCNNIMEVDLSKKDVQDFAKLVNYAVEQVKKPVASPSAQLDPVAQIKALAELKQQGIISEEEFASKKQKLLSSI